MQEGLVESGLTTETTTEVKLSEEFEKKFGFMERIRLKMVIFVLYTIPLKSTELMSFMGTKTTPTPVVQMYLREDSHSIDKGLDFITQNGSIERIYMKGWPSWPSDKKAAFLRWASTVAAEELISLAKGERNPGNQTQLLLATRKTLVNGAKATEKVTGKRLESTWLSGIIESVTNPEKADTLETRMREYIDNPQFVKESS